MRILAALLFGDDGCVCAIAGSGESRSADGTVDNSVTRAPVAGALVNFVGSDYATSVDTDANGRWRIEHLACGPSFCVAAVRVGFLPPPQLTGPALTLTANTPAHDVKLELTPQSVLAGRVTDDQGDPLLGAQVSLYGSRISNGVRTMSPMTSMSANDLGGRIPIFRAGCRPIHRLRK